MSSAAVKPTEAATKYEDSDPSAGGSISENGTVTGDGQDGGSTKTKFGRQLSSDIGSLGSSLKDIGSSLTGGRWGKLAAGSIVWTLWWRELREHERRELQKIALKVAIAECGKRHVQDLHNDENLSVCCHLATTATTQQGDTEEKTNKVIERIQIALEKEEPTASELEQMDQGVDAFANFKLQQMDLPETYQDYCLYSAKNFNRLKRLFHGVEHTIVNEELKELKMDVSNRMIVLKHLSGVKTPIQMTEEGKKKRNLWVSSILAINILYDFILDDTPSFSQVVDTVNALVLVSALMCAVVVAIPISFNLEEFDYFLEKCVLVKLIC